MREVGSLPVVDIANRRGGAAARDQIAAELDAAFRNLGFCYISNTGVPTREIFAAAADFHALPMASKQRIAVNDFHRGYIAPNSSTIRTSSVATVTRPNLSESLMIMHEVAPDDPRYGQPLQGPNQWPAELPAFRPAAVDYMARMSALARDLTRLIAIALGLPENALDAYFDQPTVWLRLLCYPPEPPGTPRDQFGAAPHTDYGFITLLAQDALGGLEVRRADGTWISATPIPDTFVVNVADMLSRWTGGRWRSTPHRVRNQADELRFSVPFFWDPSMDSLIEPLPIAQSAHEETFQAVQFGDYVMERLNRNYAYRRRA
ncbi:MAG: 2-oxoglutarate and iron-dependent oxygenase domain-containing protein [Pseudomonadota bacterium]